MLIGFVYMYVKIIGLFFMEGPHPSVHNVKTTYALGSYICNCKFYFICKIKYCLLCLVTICPHHPSLMILISMF